MEIEWGPSPFLLLVISRFIDESLPNAEDFDEPRNYFLPLNFEDFLRLGFLQVDSAPPNFAGKEFQSASDWIRGLASAIAPSTPDFLCHSKCL